MFFKKKITESEIREIAEKTIRDVKRIDWINSTTLQVPIGEE